MKFALHSVSYTSTWEGQITLGIKDVVKKAVAMGYDGIEIVAKRPHVSPLDYDKKMRAELKDYVAAQGIEIACIAGYHDFVNDPHHMNVARLEKEILWLRETIDLAADLGCPLVRVFSGFCIPGVPRLKQWQWAVQGLKEGCRYAELKGVNLALQNHSEVTINYLDVLRMVNEVGSPNLKVEIDPPYLAMTGDDYDKVVKEVGKLLVHTVASDHKEIHVPMAWYHPTMVGTDNGYFQMVRKNIVPVGQGMVDYRTFFKALIDIGYDGFVGYEVCSPIPGGGTEENIDSFCEMSLAYMKKLVAELQKAGGR